MNLKALLQQYAFLWLVSWRFLMNASRRGLWRWISIASIASISLTTIVLLIAYGIMSGLQQATKKALHSLQPDIEIVGVPLSIIAQQLGRQCQLSECQTIPSAVKNSTCNRQSSCLVLGMDCQHDPRFNQLIKNTPAVTVTGLAYDEIILGVQLAKELNVQAGEDVSILWQIDEEQTDKQRVRVRDVVQTGLDEWDHYFAVCSLELARELECTNKTTTVCCFLDNQDTLDAIAQRLKKTYGTESVTTWHEKYPALLSALRLERFGLLLLIVCISTLALLHTAAVIVLTIQQKLKSLSLLWMYDCSRMNLGALLVLVGMQAILIGAVPGMIIAYITAFAVTKTACVRLPDVYYVEYLPVQISVYECLLFMLLYIVLGAIAGLMLSRKLTTKELQKTFRS